ncbi:hypothetical protein C9994_11310 [Marivirga lumbricoides]|uniref:GFO/IDH/MocA-like oxidoreductase domain-containing protein n=1 Tax=Marivirga lumbricoides TaxID=1046115 RepID=A0A2T4DNQ8_9BACT|nr:hypothetical protein C9994_11310 [Marivirga lumbricoides]
MDLGVHMIDMALNCLGFPYVEQVRSHLYSKGKKLVPGAEEVEDFAKVSMITAKNTAIDLDCSWHVSEGRDAVMEATFYGSEGRVAFKNIDGSFSDFKAEKYNGTQTEQIAGATDEWSGRAGLEWAQKVLDGQGFDPGSANEYLQLAEIIDRVYGRQT